MSRYCLVFVVVMMTLSGCESAAQKQDKLEQEKKITAQVKAKAEAEEKLKTEQLVKAKAESEKTKNEAEKAAKAKKVRFVKLLPKFHKSKDKFDGSVTYRHKNFTPYSNTNGTGIVAKIFDNDIYCYSAFVNSDWIFHKEFSVKTGDIVKDYDGKENHEVIDGIVETVSLNSSSSEELVKQIASASSNKPIMVRLLGKYRHDFNLRASQRQAIKDTWELYQLLK